jgi:hypothetical protein
MYNSRMIQPTEWPSTYQRKMERTCSEVTSSMTGGDLRVVPRIGSRR